MLDSSHEQERFVSHHYEYFIYNIRYHKLRKKRCKESWNTPFSNELIKKGFVRGICPAVLTINTVIYSISAGELTRFFTIKETAGVGD